MTRLREERDELTKMLYDHLAVCTNNIPLPDSVCLTLQQSLPQPSNPCTNSDNFATSPSHCPSTSNSASSVFFPDDANNNPSDALTYGSFLQDLDISSIEIIQHNGSMMQDLMDAPEMGQEMVIGDVDLSDSMSEHSNETRLDSCTSYETTSNFGSISSEGYSFTDSTSELNSSLAATVTLAHINHINIHEFDNPFSTDDILLLDSTITS